MTTYNAELRGRHAVASAYSAELRGRHAVMLACTAELRGRHRVANDALTRYELFRGIDAPPDPDSAAVWETFTSLPHETAALDPAPPGPERVYYFVLRARNKYNLTSRNVASWTVMVNGDGDKVTRRPSVPDEVDIAPAASGAAQVTASYYYGPDGDYAATKWLVYLTSDGTDPDPSVDTPTVVSMVNSGGIARLDWTSSAFGDGTDVRVIVRTRRVDTGPVNSDSTNTDVHQATADTDGPDTPAPAGIFFGNQYEQHQ